MIGCNGQQLREPTATSCRSRREPKLECPCPHALKFPLPASLLWGPRKPLNHVSSWFAINPAQPFVSVIKFTYRLIDKLSPHSTPITPFSDRYRSSCRGPGDMRLSCWIISDLPALGPSSPSAMLHSSQPRGRLCFLYFISDDAVPFAAILYSDTSTDWAAQGLPLDLELTLIGRVSSPPKYCGVCSS